MYSKSLILLTSGAALVAGITPSGFTPASNTDLIVAYGQTAATNGIVVDRASTATQPTLATQAQLTGTSYAVIMVDLDIPSTSNPHTFLHWMQTGFTPSTTASAITTANGTVQGFTLTNAQNTSAIVAYTQPNPPAQNPLSHRYTEVLVDTSAMSADGITALTTAANVRVGFDINTALQAAGLTNNVVAGNSFNVTNAGPVAASSAKKANSGAKANAAGNGTAQATGGSGNQKGSKTKAAGKNKTKTGGASKATGAGADGKKGNGSKGKATATSTDSPAVTPVGAAAASPTASGSLVTGNLANSGTTGTGTATTSGAPGGYILYPVSLLVGLTGAFFWAF